MSLRCEPRVSQNFRIWVSGCDTRGHEFRQTAKLVDASWLGGRLSEIRCLTAPGQTLELRHRGKKQEFAVVWINEGEGLAGLRSLNPAVSIFGVASGPPPMDANPYQNPASAASAGPRPQRAIRASKLPPERRHARHRCQGGAEVRAQDPHQSAPRIWATLDDLSLGGCHVKTLYPLPVETAVEVRLGVTGGDIRALGIVRSSRPGIGMGISFLDLDADNHARLAQFAERLDREAHERELARHPDAQSA